MKSSRTRNATDESSLCQFPFADGRTCRMLRYPAHPALCIFHARQEQELITHVQQLQDIDAISTELDSPSGGFVTASDIQHVIGRLFKLTAANRIPRRQAQTLAYLARLLIRGQMDVRQEFIDIQGVSEWDALLRRSYPRVPARHRASATPSDQQESGEQEKINAGNRARSDAA